MTTKQKKAVLDELIAHDKDKQIIPDSVFFASTSSLKYVLEVRSASNDAVLMGVDTVSCYTNAKGELRYITTKNTPNIRKVTFGSIPVNTRMYLFVNIIQSLPLAAHFTYTGITFYEESRAHIPMRGIYQEHCNFGQ